MVSKKFKVLEIIDGKEYCFSAFAFKASLCEVKKEMKNNGENISSEDLYGQLAEATHVSADSIKNWMYAKNGPGDLQTVKDIANYLKMDYKDLLKEKEKEHMSNNNCVSQNIVGNGNTKDVIRVIYQKMSAMMDMATKQLCFYGDEEDFQEYEVVYLDMINTLHKSMLDIPIDIYDKLRDIAENELHAYMYGFIIGPVDIWDTNEFDNFCMKKKMVHDFVSETFYMEKLSNDFYAKMRDILKDYLIYS